MNFLTHAIPYLDEPFVVAGTAIPDLLSVLDRRVRVRSRKAAGHLVSPDAEVRRIAAGVVHHHADDRWFHGTGAFVETSMQLAVQLRRLLPGDEGFRPSFVGHILIEMLLDRFWIRDDESLGRRYYDAFQCVSPATIERVTGTIAGQPTPGLAQVVTRFVASRFLYDYLDDGTLLVRLNQVMNRVGLARLPDTVADWLPGAAELVEVNRPALLVDPTVGHCWPSFPVPKTS